MTSIPPEVGVLSEPSGEVLVPLLYRRHRHKLLASERTVHKLLQTIGERGAVIEEIFGRFDRKLFVIVLLRDVGVRVGRHLRYGGQRFRRYAYLCHV